MALQGCTASQAALLTNPIISNNMVSNRFYAKCKMPVNNRASAGTHQADHCNEPRKLTNMQFLYSDMCCSLQSPSTTRHSMAFQRCTAALNQQGLAAHHCCCYSCPACMHLQTMPLNTTEPLPETHQADHCNEPSQGDHRPLYICNYLGR